MSRQRKGHPPRLAGWDYSRTASYFVTFNVAGRRQVLGTLESGQVRLSEAGEIVLACWQGLIGTYPVGLDARVIMPDHVHGILILRQGSGALMNRGPTGVDQGHTGMDQGFMPMMADPAMVLGKVVRAWKARSTRLIRRTCDPGFAWQSRYYEHIIRSPAELERIRNYIELNPLKERH